MVDAQDEGGEAAHLMGSFQAASAPNARGEGLTRSGNDTVAASMNVVPSATVSEKLSDTQNSTPVPTTELPQVAEGSAQSEGANLAAPAQPAQQQSTNTSRSNSANPPAQDAASGSKPYGTRSRNTRGAARPNYAEQDADAEFEMAQATANGHTSRDAQRGRAGAESEESPAPGAKKGQPAVTAAWGAVKEPQPIPGTSSFSANPNVNSAPQPSRKRKAPGKDVVQNGVAQHSNPTIQTHTRRATAPSTDYSGRITNMLTFEKSGARLNQHWRLEADDGSQLSVNDHVYLVCEPPGEPYYLGRIMEFLHTNADDKNSPVDSMRINWFYRPRDVMRYNNDTRLVYGTMHSDICPITSLRGKCQVLHRSEIADLEEYRKIKDSFWFNQIFDRFIHRWYEVIPVSLVINVPEKVKKVLDERWKYIVVETSRVKELTSAVKTCKRCSGFCANNDSVECAVCHNTYHMNCVRPPLLKKPSRGFAWACGPCSRAQEKRLEERRTPLVGDASAEKDEDEVLEEEDEDNGAVATTAPTLSGSDAPVDNHPGTQAEIALAKMWPMRYLGIHCRVEDALQYDDRAIYPRASSRLGPRHQANVNVWHGRPVELVKPAEIKKRYVKSTSHKKDAKLSKETLAAMEADRAAKATRPKWVMDEPPGYVRRGEDDHINDSKGSAKLLFKMPTLGEHSSRGEDDEPVPDECLVDAYIARAKPIALELGLKEYQTDFLDRAVTLFKEHNYNADAALKQLRKTDRKKDLHIPEFSKEDVKKFEDGISKHGSELRSVRFNMSKGIQHGDVVRFYYMWKKTPKGQEIWGSYGGRKGKSKRAESDPMAKLADNVADAQDDSAFDNEKAEQQRRGFQCKFCLVRKSRQWRRAPGVVPGQTVPADGRSKDKGSALLLALCQRCANLWRRYAIKWENVDEMAKKVSQGGAKAWKKKIDEELRKELLAADDTSVSPTDVEQADIALPTTEPTKKKQKMAADKTAAAPLHAEAPKKKPEPPPRPPTPPIVPAEPKWRELPCFICNSMLREHDRPSDQLMKCSHCMLTVHRDCYGIEDARSGKWLCDMCQNDKKETVSFKYECVLCPVAESHTELVEPPKITHKKKTDRDREKERLEKELVNKMLGEYRMTQRGKGRPEIPREPLKRTADNNWVHVKCAVWMPETKFSNAKALELVEGVGSPLIKYDQTCKICKMSDRGACVSCHQCHASFHVGCAHKEDYIFGFDVSPVKSTRRDAITVIKMGPEVGLVTAAIWCKDHNPKTIIHPIDEWFADPGCNALQLYVRNYKQADLTLTGTARKANLMDQSTRVQTNPAALALNGNRRASAVQTTPIASRAGRNSSAGVKNEDQELDITLSDTSERTCAHCSVDVTPRWYKVENTEPAQTSGADDRRPADVLMVNGDDTRGDGMMTIPRDSSRHHLANGVPANETTTTPVIAPTAPAVRPVGADDSTTIVRSTVWYCQKCNWKSKHAPHLLEEDKKKKEDAEKQAEVVGTPPQVIPGVDPRATFPAVTSQWPPSHAHTHAAPFIPPPFNPPHAVPTWHAGFLNGAAPMSAHMPGPPPSYHPPHAPPPPHRHSAGYIPMTTQEAQARAAGALPSPSPFPGTNRPTPLQLHTSPRGAEPPTNGLPSPRFNLLGSPAHPPPLHRDPSRQTESPSMRPAHVAYNPPYGAPDQGQAGQGPYFNGGRPSTPREPSTAPVDNRAVQGASASPSLRNLLS